MAIAKIEIGSSEDVAGIAQRAGSADCYYENGVLYCRDVEQAALNAELAKYDPVVFAAEQQKRNAAIQLDAINTDMATVGDELADKFETLLQTLTDAGAMTTTQATALTLSAEARAVIDNRKALKAQLT